MAGQPILIAEDDPTIRAVVAEALEHEGYAAATASDGAEALAALARAEPRLLVLDLRMPRVSGQEVARVARARGLTMPILVLTAEREGARQAVELGAADWLLKPFDLADLLTAVERLVGPAA